MSQADIMARQQQQSFPFLSGRGVPSIVFQNPVPPEQMRHWQDMRRIEQVMMASQPSAALGMASQGLPRLPGGMLPNQVFGAPQNIPGTAQWAALGANPPFIPPDRLDPRFSLGVAQVNPLQGMMNSQSIAHEEEMNMLRSMIRQQEENIMNLKRQRGWASPPAKRQHVDSSVEQWNQQNLKSQAGGLPQMLAPVSPRASKLRKRHVKSFPVKLMEAITEYYDETIIAWLPDGKSIVVVDPEKFCDQIISKAFKGGKYSSFVRKLNRWGFTRLISGTGMDCFHHPLFQRNRMDLCALITCAQGGASSSESTSRSNTDPATIQTMEKPSLQGIEKFFAFVNSKEIVAGKVPESTEEEDENEKKRPAEVNMKEAASKPH